MTPEQLAADRAICDAATPGEWHRGKNYKGQNNVWADGQLDITPAIYDLAIGMSDEDCKFIAAARMRWPAALDEIERLLAVIKRHHEQKADDRVLAETQPPMTPEQIQDT